MKAYQLFLAFFLLQLLSFKPVVSSSVLEDVCNYIGDSYGYYPCMKMIGPDPRSKTVKDIRDVALLAADISIDKAVEYQSYAKELLENATDADTKVKAEGAIRIFTDVIKDLKFVKESLIANSHSGVTSAAEDAKNADASAGNLVNFKKFDNDYYNISFVLLAILAHMKW